MLNFGWKKAVAQLKMVILSGAHAVAKELSPGLAQMLVLYRDAAVTGDLTGLEQLVAQDRAIFQPEPLWEPADVHGWTIRATLYRQDGDLWWLVHAIRKNHRSPSDKDILFLNKVLEHLGAQPTRHEIIGPNGHGQANDGAMPFGWWTWKNQGQLYDIQAHRTDKKNPIRIVPLGTRPTDGYESLRWSEDDKKES
jgi:hypothetical protein